MGQRNIESWMYRESNEILYLMLTIVLVIILGLLVAQINLYILIIGLVIGFVYIKLQQAQLVGNALEITNNQMPHIFQIFDEQKKLLQLTNVRLYIIQDPNPNAFTIGFPTASIILASSLVEAFSKEELSFTIAHELGHVKAGHNVILTFISPLGNSVWGSSLIFSFWRRKAEYSGDRCGLILTKNIDNAVTGLLKLSVGLHLSKDIKLDSYKEQLIGSKGGLVGASELLFDHPLTTNRIHKLVYFWRKNFTH